MARVFKCNPPSGLRVSLAALCNGVDDCPTGEDEEQHEGQAEGLDEGTALCSGTKPVHNVYWVIVCLYSYVFR